MSSCVPLADEQLVPPEHYAVLLGRMPLGFKVWAGV